jgi:hypothetical protein
LLSYVLFVMKWAQFLLAYFLIIDEGNCVEPDSRKPVLFFNFF